MYRNKASDTNYRIVSLYVRRADNILLGCLQAYEGTLTRRSYIHCSFFFYIASCGVFFNLCVLEKLDKQSLHGLLLKPLLASVFSVSQETLCLCTPQTLSPEQWFPRSEPSGSNCLNKNFKDQNLVMITRLNTVRKCDLKTEAILSQRL